MRQTWVVVRVKGVKYTHGVPYGQSLSLPENSNLMPIEQALLLFIVGLAAGVLSGMFGIGGGVVIVPVLIALLNFDQLQANGTSLAALLMPVGIFAVMAYYRKGKLGIAAAAWVALGIVFGGFAGAELAIGLPADTLKRLYGFFLLYVSWRFIEPRKLFKLVPAQATAPTPEEPPIVAWYVLAGVGVLAGVASGLFGIGGGLIIVPALMTLLRFDQHQAVGTSLAALLLPVALPAVISYYNAGKLDVGVAAMVALGLIGGAFVGAKIALSLPATTVKRIYGVFLVIMALRFIVG